MKISTWTNHVHINSFTVNAKVSWQRVVDTQFNQSIVSDVYIERALKSKAADKHLDLNGTYMHRLSIEIIRRPTTLYCRVHHPPELVSYISAMITYERSDDLPTTLRSNADRLIVCRVWRCAYIAVAD